MDNAEILEGPSFCPIEKPKKLIFLLHGYGDNADNFVHIAGNFSHEELSANYFALNAPNLIANYPTGSIPPTAINGGVLPINTFSNV